MHNKRDILVSVVVPVFNTEKYLKKCLDSLVNQTIESIEILVVIDAANPDNSAEIAYEYEKEYPEKLKVFIAPEGRLGDNRNFGLEHSNGEYIAFVDSDDYVATNMYESMSNYAINENADIVVCGYKRLFYMENKTKNYFAQKNSVSVKDNPDILLSIEPYAWNKLYKKSLFIENDIRYPSSKGFEDVGCTYLLAIKANKIFTVREPLYMYRWQRDGFASHANDERIFDAMSSCRLVCDYYKQNDAFELCRSQLEKICFDRIFYRFDHIYKDPNIKQLAKKYISESFKFMDSYFPGWQKKYRIKFLTSMKEFAKTHKWMALLYIYIPKFVRRLWTKNKKKIVKKSTKHTSGHVRKNGYDIYLSHYNDELEDSIYYESHEGLNMTCSPFAMFLKIKNDPYFKNYSNIWLIEDNVERERIKKKYTEYNIKFVSKYDGSYAKTLATARYLITNTTLPAYFTKKKGQTLIETWHGTPIKALGRSAANKGAESFNICRTFLQSDYLLSPNEYTTEIFRRDYQLDGIYTGKILEGTYPRDQLLIEADRNKLFSDLVDSDVEIDKNKKIIMYLPTWRGTKTAHANSDICEIRKFLFDLEELIDTNEYQVLLKPHHLTYRHLESNDKKNINIIPSTANTEELLKITDIVISDYSSVVFDFMFTGRQMLFYINDLEEYNNDHGLYIGVDELPGPVSDNVAEIAHWVNNIEDKKKEFEERYSHWLKKVCISPTKDVTQEIIDIAMKNTDAGSIIDGDVVIKTFTDDKKKILISCGNIKLLKSVDKFIDLLSQFDAEKHNVTVMISCSYWERQEPIMRYFLEKVPPQVKILARERYALESEEIKLERKRINKSRILNYNNVSDTFNDYLKTEFLRIFGDVKFDIAIDYMGQNTYYTLLLMSQNTAKQFLYYQDLFLPSIDEMTNGMQKVLNLSREMNGIIVRSQSVLEQFERSQWRKQNVFLAEDKLIHNESEPKKITDNNDDAYLLSKKGDAATYTNGTIVQFPINNASYITDINVHNTITKAFLDGYKNLCENNNDIILFIICNKKAKNKLEIEITSRMLNENVVVVDDTNEAEAIFSICNCYINLPMAGSRPYYYFLAKHLGLKRLTSAFLGQSESEYVFGCNIEASADEFQNIMNDFSNIPEYQNEMSVVDYNEIVNRQLISIIESED